MVVQRYWIPLPVRYQVDCEKCEVTTFMEKKNFKQVVLVIPESNNGMNNVLTQIIGEKLGNLEDVAKSWKKEKHSPSNMQCHQKRIPKSNSKSFTKYIFPICFNTAG